MTKPKRNLFQWLSKAAIMNDFNAGPVAQAAGYSTDPDSFEQDVDSEGAKQLRKNLAILAGTAYAGPALNAVLPTLGTELTTFAPVYKQAGTQLIKDLPAFLALDSLPTLFGYKPYTGMGGDMFERAFRATMPDNKFTQTVAPYINTVGQFASGFPVGIVSGLGTRAVEGAIGSAIRGPVITQPHGESPYVYPETTTVVEQAPTTVKPIIPPYEIEKLAGFQIRPLMSGNILEKQLSKSGTINTNSIRAYASKMNATHRKMMEDVLNSPEFAGQKAIDYNAFRRAVQKRIPTYSRTSDSRYADYGVDRIGYTDWENLEYTQAELEVIPEFTARYTFSQPNPIDGSTTIMRAKYPYEEVPQEELEAFIKTLPQKPGYKLDTFTYSSDVIPRGSARHYDSNTLGHARTMTTTKDPQTRYFLESQSDYGQRRYYDTRGNAYNRTEYVNNFGDANLAEARARETLFLSPEEIYLKDNWEKKQLYENLKATAELGQKTARFPTEDSAAKIEGYSQNDRYVDLNGNLVEPDEATTRGDYIDRLIKEYNEKINKSPGGVSHYMRLCRMGDVTPELISEGRYDYIVDDLENLISKTYLNDRGGLFDIGIDDLQGAIDAFRIQYGRDPNLLKWREGNVYRKQLQHDLNLLYNNPTSLRDGYTTYYGYLPQHQTILKKYSDFPKLFQKQFPGQEIRTVTDANGNSWYEVDVPENILTMEIPYKQGGKLCKSIKS